MNVKLLATFAVAAVATVAIPAIAADMVLTEPIGFNKITCLANSDTIVGVPLRQQGSIATRLSAAPDTNGESATLALAHTSLPVNGLDRHCLKFNGGTRDGRWYDITANSESSVTIDLNGDNLSGVTADENVIIVEYWTLDTLFPPDQATTDWAEDPENPGNFIPNGHAIVASPNALNRRTLVLFPDLAGQGINRAPVATHFITSGVWKKFGDTSIPDFGSTVIYPDQYLIIRHNPSVLYSTIFRSVGEVDINPATIMLTTRDFGRQDNFIGLPRPVGVKLSELNLSSDVFEVSPSSLNRKDLLLVFDNETAIRNRAPSATYYKLASGWRRVGDASSHDDTEIPPGAGFMIRKGATAGGVSIYWINTANY